MPCCHADQQAKASPSAEAAPSASASASEQQRGARFEELKAQSTGRAGAPRADKPKRASFRDVVSALSMSPFHAHFYTCRARPLSIPKLSLLIYVCEALQATGAHGFTLRPSLGFGMAVDEG